MNMTGKELAKLLGVSQSTISMVLNNKPGISDEKRQEILSKMKEMNFDGLVKQQNSSDDMKQKTIGFVVFKRHGDILSESPFITLLVEAVSAQLRKYQCNLVVVQVDKFTLQDRMQELIESGCDGIILDAVEMQSDDLDRFNSLPIPFVIFNNSFVDRDLNTVCVYNQQGIYKALTYLIGLGHEHIGYIKCKSPVRSFDERLQTYQDLMSRFHLQINPEDICTLPYSQLGAYEEMKQFLDHTRENNQKLPTAFICDNDIICYAAIHALKECGYKVPEDISLIGFDDRPFCTTVEPQITTLRIPRQRFGAEAVNILLEMINDPEMTPVTVHIGVELIERASTGNCAIR